MTDRRYLLGMDIGGSHVTCARVDAVSFEMLAERVVRREFDTHGSAESVLSVFAEVIHASAGQDWAGVAGIGFAFPGPFDYPNGICRIPPELKKFEQCYGLNVREALHARLDFKGPIGFLNDAACFAIGEFFAGGARGSARTLVITLGTGFGTTFLAGGHPVTAGDTVPERDGMLWHVPFAGGMADDTFSTRGLVHAWQEASGEKAQGVKEIAQRALQGDLRAVGVFQTFGSRMAEFLAPWLTRFGADTVVLGGNIAKDWSLFVPSLESGVRGLVPHPVRIKPSELGEKAQMLGAAAAVLQGD